MEYNFLELKNINKNNLDKVATYFSENYSTEKLKGIANIIADNGYGTLFLEAKSDNFTEFFIHMDNSNPLGFSSITFMKSSLSIEVLIALYLNYQKIYIPYDEECCYRFKSLNSIYCIEVYVDGNCSECISKLKKINRLTIRW